MDVRSTHWERVFSILNDNDCPSFVIRQRRSPEPPTSSHTKSPDQRRPSLLRQAQYKRTSSFSSSSSSASDSAPPLLRFNSSSSKSSNSSMDASLSPITPAYNYNDPSLMVAYENVLRPDMNINMNMNMTGFMQNSTGITPLMEQPMIMAPVTDPFQAKALTPLPAGQYPILPAPAAPTEVTQLPTPTSLNSVPNSATASSLTTSTSPPNNAPPTGKKNKYPCPYAQSHSCSASFTTSGHAARHGKKHTGEKGVHCPICNKAFTRKDNMKQHERTHKNNSSSSNTEESTARRSKAAVTRDSQRNKQLTKSESLESDPTSIPSLQSPLSEVTSAAPSLEAPIARDDQAFYSCDITNQVLPVLPVQTMAESINANSLYPPITDETLMAAANAMAQPIPEKLMDMSDLPAMPMPPTLVRGFSDLDTLAQAAETFDPYYQPTM